MYDINVIANYFIKKSVEDDRSEPMTVQRLIKLCIFAQIMYLKGRDRLLFLNSIECWKYGPIIPKLYEQIKHYRDNTITSTLTVDLLYEELDIQDVQRLDILWNEFSSYTGVELASVINKYDYFDVVWNKALNEGKSKTVDYSEMRKAII